MRSLVVGMDLVFSPVSAQVLVVMEHSERHAAAMMLQVELGVVVMVLVGQIDLVAIDGHILAVGGLDLDDVIMKVLDVEEAMVAMGVVFEAEGAMLSDEVLAMNLEGHFAASCVVAKAMGWRVDTVGGGVHSGLYRGCCVESAGSTVTKGWRRGHCWCVKANSY